MKSRTVLIVFLGNPGRTYEKTRHNAAWMLLPCLAEILNIPDLTPGDRSWKEKFNGLYRTEHPAVLPDGTRLHLLLPMKYMNRSGQSVAAAEKFFSLDGTRMIIVHDDLELPFGAAAVKWAGGTGGHNGLRSIVQALGHNQFYRLRLGIGRPEQQREPQKKGRIQSVSSFVLSRFSPGEESRIPGFLSASAGMLMNQLAENSFSEMRISVE